MIAQIQMRRGTTAEWAAANPVVLAAGEMGLDTTIKKTKIGDGTTEWASLPWLNGDVTNPNILHNWDFRNPVNQRGITSTVIGTGVYFYDRWMATGTIYQYGSGNNKYLGIASDSYIEQRIEGSYLAGIECCFSFYNNNNALTSIVGVFPTANGTYNDYKIGSNILVRFGLSAGGSFSYVLLKRLSSSTMGVNRVKLELGIASTLAYDPPVDHVVELPKCQRFFYSLNNNFIAVPGYTGSTNVAYVTVATPVTMRIAPTFSGTTPTLRVEGSNYETTVSAVVLNNNMVRLNLAATGFPANDTVNAYLGSCEFSADL